MAEITWSAHYSMARYTLSIAKFIYNGGPNVKTCLDRKEVYFPIFFGEASRFHQSLGCMRCIEDTVISDPYILS